MVTLVGQVVSLLDFQDVFSMNIMLEVGCMLFQMQFWFSERLKFKFLGIVL